MANALDAAPQEIEIRAPIAELIEHLSQPAAWGLDTDTRIDVVQTHISAVFLTPSRAYKLKKPIRLWDLLDYGTVEQRKWMCEREVELNRRLAPDIYLGVVPIVRKDGLCVAWMSEKEPKPDRIVDHVVEMVRVPDEASWNARVRGGHLDEGEVTGLARLLADFHHEHRLAPELTRESGPQRLAKVFRRNFGGTREAVPRVFPEHVHEGLYTRMARRLWRMRDLIRQRAVEERMVNGHGDLRLEHVVRHKGRVAVMDCVEFTSWLRHIDPLSDVAFLSMDLTAFGRPDLARALEVAYLELSGDADSRRLLPLYRAYRAHVRAMVNEQTARDEGVDPKFRAEKLRNAKRNLALAWSYARSGATPPLIVFRGPSGSGKSHLAAKLAPWLRGHVERSDVVRKTLMGMAPTDRPDDEERALVYGSEMSRKTYEELQRRGIESLDRGEAGMLDATFLRKASREAIRALARKHDAPYAIVDLRCDPDEIRSRLRDRAARNDDASDADIQIYEGQLREAEPVDGDELPFLVVHEQDTPPEETALAIVSVLEQQLDARTERPRRDWPTS